MKAEKSTNLIAKAKNGSGKSLALSIAFLARIGASDKKRITEETDAADDEQVNIEGLVLAPTREIAIQLFDYFNLLTKDTDTEATLLIGGLDMKEQRKQILLKRPKVIFATLGRFIEVVTEKEWLSLSKL